MKGKYILKNMIFTAVTASLIGSSIVVPVADDSNTAPSAPTGLLTNELNDPLNVENPTFGWIVNDSDFNEVQTAYEIIVTDGVTGEIAWDSGKVESSEQSYVACGGALKEGYPYSWRVKTWDKNGAESPYSEEAAFATGISDESWDADWISDGTGGAAVTQGKYNHFWYVRGSGTLENGKTIAKAMGYFAGCQDYDLYINGEEIGRGQSFDYASETRYQGWDITEAVKKDSNTLTAGAIVRTYGPGQGRAATDAAFIGRINVYYTDGTSSVITTSSDWTVSTSVPFSGTTTRNGEGDFVEKYNAANAQDGFSTDDFDAAGWTPAVVLGTNTTSEITSITPELSKPTSYEVHPVSVTVLDDGTTVADFGTVIPARPCIVFKNGTAGREIQLQGSYVLLSTGAVNITANGTQDTDMRWVYTQKAGEQTYNAWDHLAFRYLSIPACGEAFTTDTITAKVVHTNVPEDRDSTLETSNTMLNSVFELMKRSSLYSVQNSFVDTPTREKGQFLQDSINISEASMATVFEREASRKAIDQFICSMERFWTDSDGTLNGHINSVYPNGDGQRDIPDFTVNFPYWIWNYYMTTGDKATLEKAYPYAKAVADYISKYISSETGLVTKLDGGNNAPNSYQYGIVDWPESGRFGYDWTNTKNGARSTVNMISKRAFDVVSNMAEVIGNSADQADMENRSAAIKAAINNKLLNSDGLFCDGLNSNGEQVAHVSQHANSYALAFDIAPEENRAAMAEYVAGLGMQQGPMTADILAKGLFSSGEYAAALKLFTEPEDYGWAKEIKKGYSFTFESWKADTSSDSQSHGWGATAAADILENFAGVSNLAPGASKVRIAPAYTALTSLNASVSTERGAVKVSYTRDEASYDIAITVPANVTAELDLPIIGSGQFIEKNGNAGEGTMGIEYQTINLGSGSYEFTYSGEITVQPEEVEYSPERDVIQGIAGSADTEKKIYTYEIGDGIADIAGTTYSDTSKYIDLTVSLAANDALYEEIQFAGASIGETNSVNDTKRALIARPKADGTLSLTIGFPSATSSKKCRIYYYDFENGDYDLSVCTKANGTIAGSDFTSSTEGVRTIDMKAGHVYVIYTYQTQSNISAIAYAYTEEPEDATQAPSEPTATKQPADGQDSVLNGKYMHISFDDVYACLKDITDNEYGSVFENSFLADLKSLHDSFGAVFTLNCFNKYSSDSSYSISDLPDRYSQELAANSDWLKFAFHAEDDKTQYTAQVVSGRTNGTAEELKASYESFRDAVMKATGNNAASIDTVTRLGFFAGDADCVDAICELGVTGLLTADDTRASYYFDEALNNYIIANNDYYDTVKNLRLIRSQLRLESVKDTQSALSALEGYNGNMLEIFTHEQEYTGNVPARLRAYVEWAYNNGYAFDYAMNVPGELMKITSKSQSGTRVDYNLQVSTTDGTTVIAAAYNDDNTLHELRTAEVKDNTAQLTIDIPNEESAVKFMLWDSLEGMKPITEGIISENNPAVSAITLNYNNYPLVVGNASKTDFSDWETRGSTVTLSAAVGSGSEYTASDITWSSADPSIATVSAAGKVQGRTTGVTRIFASLPNGDTKACDITVIDNVTRLTVQRIEFNADELKLAVGSSAELIPIIYPKEVYDNGVLNKSLIWSSSDESVAAVENGVVTAKTAGTAVITAVSADVGRTGAMTVTVSDNITAETISGPENTVGMRTGESTQLYAGEGDIIWTSDNSYIADVDETGVVTAYSNSKRPAVGTDGQVVFENGRVKYEDDTVKIYATAKNGGETKVFNVSVADAEASVQSVAVNKSEISIANGTTAELTAAILPANLIDKEVVWSSSNESVARVTADGRTIYGLCKADIDGITAGTAVITAECDGKTAECTVTVTNGAVKVSEIRISGKNEIDLDEYTELKAEVTANANNKELAWISADRSIATVNNEGTVMGWGAGTVKIYAVAIDGVDADSAKLLEKARTVTADEVEALGGVTAEFELTVKDSSSYLRWVHAPEEGITEDSVNILWSRASGLDTAELAAYEVYVNGVKTDSVTTEGYTIKKLAADTDYSIDVKAVDAGGRVLAQDCIAVRTKPRSEVINVLDYGAVGNGRVTDTYAIQKAIDACPENGTVLLPEGYVFYSGALFLKSNMTFKVDGILLGSAYDKDYPFIVTRWEGWRKLYQTAEEWANTTSSLPENHYPHASLINAGTYDEGENSHTGPYNTENITICGKGQINGNGFTLGYNEGLNQKTGDGGQPEPMTPAMDQTIRGRLITIHNCDGIYMKDVMIAYGPSWTIHPIYSRNMTFDAIPIVSKGDGMTGAADDICILNGDGIDPDSSVNVNIFNINFCTGDDGVAVKTGRNKEGNDLDKPTAYLRITDCISDGSKGAFAFGSENASGVHDAILQNLTVKNIMLSHSVWFKTYWPRGGDTYDIAVRDIDSTKRIDIAANYATSENNPADDPPTYSYLTFENCNPSFVMEGLKATNGRPETYIENVTLRGCTGSGTISYGRNIDIWDVQQSRWTLGTGTTDIHFLYSDSDTNTMLKAAEGAGHISSVNNDTFTIITAIGTTADEILAELESYVPGAELGMELNEDATVLTVTSANGEAVVEYTISYAKVWDFKEYTTEVKTTESGFTEEYDGLTIAIADNGADSDHDKITTAGVYWRGGASSGDSPRYIAYTPVTDGTLEVTGKLNSSGGRWGISDSLDVASLKADQSSTTSTSTATLSLKCSAGTTYYIITKTRSATVNRVCYISE